MNIKNFLKINLIIFILFLVLYYITTGISSSSYGSYFFLPHAVRVIAAVIYGPVAFLGLFLSHFAVGEFFSDREININLLLSLVGSSMGYISFYILVLFKLINQNLHNTKFEHVLFIILLSSILNSVCNSLVFESISDLSNFKFITTYLVGDFLGGSVGFYLFLKILNKIEKK